MERRPRRNYTREFKLEAVRLATVDGRPKAQIARQLGIRVNQLRKWRQEFERENTRPNASSPPVATEDMEQLRREIARLRIENEIPKKRRFTSRRNRCEAPLRRGAPAPLWGEGAV